MAFWNSRKIHEPWRLRQYGSNPPPPCSCEQKPPPPPGPPERTVSEWSGETPESIRDREDWQTYMSGFSHGLAVARSNTALSRPGAASD